MGGGVCERKAQVSHLEKKNELREALDGLHHQAVERDAVHAGGLLPLLTQGDIQSWTAGNAQYFFFPAPVSLFCFFCLQRNIILSKSMRFTAKNRSTSEFPGEEVWACEWEREREREVRKLRPASHMHR